MSATQMRIVPVDDVTEETYLSLKTKSGSYRRVTGFIVPNTDRRMFVRQQSDENWAITHVPTRARIIWVYEKLEALHFAKLFYDAAIAEGIAIDSAEKSELKGWGRAIEKHVPEFAP